MCCRRTTTTILRSFEDLIIEIRSSWIRSSKMFHQIRYADCNNAYMCQVQMNLMTRRRIDWASIVEERSLIIVDIMFTSYANFEKRVKALLFAFGIYLFICCILFVDVPRRKRNCSEVWIIGNLSGASLLSTTFVISLQQVQCQPLLVATMISIIPCAKEREGKRNFCSRKMVIGFKKKGNNFNL